MQSNTSASAKPREAKRSKWKLFSKGTGKSTENLSHEHARNRHSASSGASEGTSGSHGSYTTEDWKPPVNGQVRPNQPPAQTSRIMTRQVSDAAGRPPKSIPLIKSPMTTAQQPKEVRPAVIATQGGTSMHQNFQPNQKQLQPNSALSSSSTPTVRQETYTDPVTGETVTKTITTVLTETTTTQITRPAMSPDQEDEIDMEEERRLAMEYLAANERRAAPGLQAPPRSRGLIGQSNRRPSIPVPEMAGVQISSQPRRLSSSRQSPEQHSSEQSYDRQPAERYSPENDSTMPQSWTNHSDVRQDFRANHSKPRDNRAPDEDYRHYGKPVVAKQKAPPETRIHAQTGYGTDMRNDAHNDTRNVETTYGTNVRNNTHNNDRNDARNDTRTQASNATRSDTRNDAKSDIRNAQSDHESDDRNGHQNDSHNESHNDLRVKPSHDIRSVARNDNRKYVAPDDDDDDDDYHRQQNHGSPKSGEPAHVPARREERHGSLSAKTERPTNVPAVRKDSIAQSSDDEKSAKPRSRPTSRGRSPQLHSQHKLTPPIEEHEARDIDPAVPNRRSSWGAVGGGSRGKADTKARDSVVTKVNPLMEHPVKGINGMNGINKTNGITTHGGTDGRNGVSETAGTKVMNRHNNVDGNAGMQGNNGVNGRRS